VHERERRSVEILPILGEPSAAIEPRNGALPSGCLIEHPRLTSRSIAGGGRGRPHAAARSGSVSALTGAPFGYRYVRRDLGGGVARFEVVEEEACAKSAAVWNEWVARRGGALLDGMRRRSTACSTIQPISVARS
jgi:hypothetical protein